jgi:hypothetical protein
VDFASLFGVKSTCSVVGGFLLMVGSSIEPSIGIWVISLGGSLLTVALGEDQSIKKIVLNLCVGLFWGIFGSQIIHVWEPLIPQIAASFFISMFGVHATQYLIRNFKTGNFSDIVVAIFDRIIPWKKNPERKIEDLFIKHDRENADMNLKHVRENADMNLMKDRLSEDMSKNADRANEDFKIALDKEE